MFNQPFILVADSVAMGIDQENGLGAAGDIDAAFARTNTLSRHGDGLETRRTFSVQGNATHRQRQGGPQSGLTNDIGTDGPFGAGGAQQDILDLHRIDAGTAHRFGNYMPGHAGAVPGICVGVGWAYALCCDIVLVSERARFAQIFRNIGLVPDGGSVWLLRQQLGAMRAKEIIYSGRMVGADEAVALGLALEKVESAVLMDRAMEIAKSFANGPVIATGLAKRQFDLAAANAFDQFLDMEFTMQPIASRTGDHHEGVQAFREKRPPLFKGD